MKQHLLLCLLLGCSACLPQKHLRQQAERKQHQQSLTTHSDSQRLEIHMERLTLQTDQNQVYAELWPSGEFRYSPDSGFVGKAIRITLHQQRQRLQQSSDSSSFIALQEQLNQRQENSSQQKRHRMLQKEVKGAGHWLYLGAGLVLLIILAFLYGAYARFRNR